MQNVSQKWKDNQNDTLVSESFVEISIDLTDPESMKDATPTDNGSVYFSNTDGILGNEEATFTPNATLEQNIWLLDGSMSVPQVDKQGVNGYVGAALSDATGGFATPPVVALDFSQIHSNLLPGITIVWGKTFGDYPTEFTIKAYNGDTLVQSKKITDNNTVETNVLVAITDYDNITIEINKWCLPYRRARVEHLYGGIVKTYTKSDIVSYSHSQEIDVLSGELPKTGISFSIDNTSREYDLNNPEGMMKYLVEKQEIKVRYGYKIDGAVEWIKAGTFYLSDWKAEQNGNTIDFNANDIIELLNVIYDQGTYYEEGRSLYDLAVDVLTFANLPPLEDGSVRWSVDEKLKDIVTIGVLPIDTVANCLQLIANAGCCVFFQDRQGRFKLISTADVEMVESDYVISSDNSYSKPEIELTTPVKQVTVQYYAYEPNVNEKDLAKLKIPLSSLSEENIIRYDHHLPGNNYDNEYIFCNINGDHISTGYLASDGNGDPSTWEILERYSGYTVYKVNIDFDRVNEKAKYLYIENDAYVVDSGKNPYSITIGTHGDEISVDNPLIDSYERAKAVAEWVQKVVIGRQKLSFSWRADPRLDVADVIYNRDVYSNNNVLMTRVEYAYNGAFRGTGEGRVI